MTPRIASAHRSVASILVVQPITTTTAVQRTVPSRPNTLPSQVTIYGTHRNRRRITVNGPAWSKQFGQVHIHYSAVTLVAAKLNICASCLIRLMGRCGRAGSHKLDGWKITVEDSVPAGYAVLSCTNAVPNVRECPASRSPPSGFGRVTAAYRLAR